MFADICACLGGPKIIAGSENRSVARVRCAVVGLGHWGPNIARGFSEIPGAELVAVFDNNRKRLRELESRFPGIHIGEDFNEFAAAGRLDALAISTPSATHFDIARQALNHGLHLLVEKPLTINSSEAFELVALAQKKNLVLMVGHTFLFNAGIEAAKKYISENALGKILYLRSIRTNLGPIRQDVSALWDLASHDISIANYLFEAEPVEVSCRGFRLLGSSLEDVVQGSLSYADGRVATFVASWLDPQKNRQITIVGDKKMIVFDDMLPARPIRIFDKGATRSPDPSYADSFDSFRTSIFEGDIVEPAVSTGQPLAAECRHFIDAVRSGAVPRSDGGFGARVVEVLEALEQSLQSGGSSVSIAGRNQLDLK